MNSTLRKTFAPAALLALLANAGTIGIAAPRQETKPAPTEKPANKSQESVAAKKPFATIKAADEAIAKALPAKDLEGAKKLVGKEGAFTGTVTQVYVAKGDSLIILDFDAQYKTALTAKLGSESFDKFPKMKDLSGKTVLIKGKFTLYKTLPQIELTDPAQIKIVEK